MSWQLKMFSFFVMHMLIVTVLPPISPVILKDSHYVLFYLTPAIQPRMLVAFDEDLSPLLVTVRVGQVRVPRSSASTHARSLWDANPVTRDTNLCMDM